MSACCGSRRRSSTTRTASGPNPTGSRSGGHQASSASMSTIMTSLWFQHLRPRGPRLGQAARVAGAARHQLPAREAGRAVLDHAATVRRPAELPQPRKDPDPVDYSTGSVGIGATAPIWGAVARRYVDCALRRRRQLGASTPCSVTPSWTRARAGRRSSTRSSPTSARSSGSWTSIGSRWTASCPNISATRLQGDVRGGGLAGDHRRSTAGCCRQLFDRPGGDALRQRIDEMSNPEYQRLLRLHRRAAARATARRRARDAAASPSCSPNSTTTSSSRGVPQPGRARPRSADGAFAPIDDTRPTVIFAYTIKGHGLASAGHPQNHSALLTAEQMARARGRRWVPIRTRPWARFTPGSRGRAVRPDGRRGCAATPRPHSATPGAAHRLRAHARRARQPPSGPRPDAAGPHPGGPEAARRVVTVSPDVGSTHQPRRLGEQGRRLVADGATGTGSPTTPRRSCTGVSADRPAHRTRHRRDQPGRPARRARRHVEPLGRAAAADRRGLRPVRRTGSRAVVVRHLRRRAVDPGRHAVRGDSRPRRRRAPVDHHPVDRSRAARLHRVRAGVRPRHRVGAARLSPSTGHARRQPRRTCASPPGRSTRRSPTCPPIRRRESVAASRGRRRLPAAPHREAAGRTVRA